MDRVLGDHRLDDFGDVFDDPRTRSLTTLQLATAMRATLQAMRLTLVDLDGPFTANALVSRLGTGLLVTFGVVRLCINRHHAGRRRGGRLRVAVVAFEFGNTPARRQHGQGDSLGAEFVKLPCQRLVKPPTQRGVDDGFEYSRRPWLHAL